jgi:glycerol-1-phosphate dehydrogenase [NAD(P)+]
MQHATQASHGFKVGVATLAVAEFYERLLEVQSLDIDSAVARWRTWDDERRAIEKLFDIPELRDKALLETREKWIEPPALRDQLTRLGAVWPELKQRIRAQLFPSDEIRRRLMAAGAPTTSQEIGISPQRLRESFLQAYHIRRRFTVLDLAARAAVFDQCIP